ncbi:MAG: hypothetical protein Q7U03_07955 [Syntrophales bacterium]|nr:hypothetical protein [Syntrophales bacterium]
MKNVVILSVAICLLSGCASGPRTNFRPVSNYYSAKSASSQGVVKISKINITGDLKGSTADLIPPFVAGFSKNNSTVSLVDDNKDITYFDSELILDIATKSSLSAADYYKTIPIVSIYSMYGVGIDFNWNVTVNYLFNDIDSKPIEKGSFALAGSDRLKPGGAEKMLSMYIGIGLIAKMYPDTESQHAIGNTLMGVVGEEIAKRLNADPIRVYLAGREKQRDGMDVKTYVKFIEKKKRLEDERAIAKTERLKGLDVQVKTKDQLADIKSGTVMVLGIGVSKYQSPQIPALKYADRDSQRIVSNVRLGFCISG